MRRKLRDLCLDIERRYADGKSLHDMMGLVEELVDRTDEILSLIDPYTSADDAAAPAPQPTPIPHADLIRAVLDGKVVQYKNHSGQWTDVDATTAMANMVLSPTAVSYRIKPVPIVKFFGAYQSRHGVEGTCLLDEPNNPHAPEVKYTWSRVELDPDTLVLISATPTDK